MTEQTKSLCDHGSCAANTDREIWRKGGGDGNGMSYYEPHIFATQDDAIGIDVGGTVVTMPVEMWHELAVQRLAEKLPSLTRKPPQKRLWAFLKEPCDAPNWVFGYLAIDAIFNGVLRLLGG